MIYIVCEVASYGGMFSAPDTHVEKVDTIEQAIAWIAEKAKTGFPYFINSSTHVFDGNDITKDVLVAAFPPKIQKIEFKCPECGGTPEFPRPSTIHVTGGLGGSYSYSSRSLPCLHHCHDVKVD